MTVKRKAISRVSSFLPLIKPDLRRYSNFQYSTLKFDLPSCTYSTMYTSDCFCGQILIRVRRLSFIRSHRIRLCQSAVLRCFSVQRVVNRRLSFAGCATIVHCRHVIHALLYSTPAPYRSLVSSIVLYCHAFLFV